VALQVQSGPCRPPCWRGRVGAVSGCGVVLSGNLCRRWSRRYRFL